MDIVLNAQDLSAEARAIIESRDEAINVSAIAGSGKTTLLAHLALHHCRAGVPPEKIGLLTVSRSAARHLSDVLTVLERHHRVRLPRAITVHKLCMDLLQNVRRAGIGNLDRLDILTEQDERLQDALRQAIERAPMYLADEEEFPHANPSNLTALYNTLSKIKGECQFDLQSLLQNDDIDVPALANHLQQPEMVIACLIAFERIREREGFLTFPDTLLEVRHLYHTEPASRYYLARYDVLAIDEANDLNKALLLAALVSRCQKGRVILVGDPNQCVQIHTGAQRSVVETDFGDLVSQVRTMPLSATHRCGPQLAKTLKPLMYHEGEPEQQFTSRAKHRTAITVKAIDDVQDIITLLAEVRKKNPDWRTAILYRQRCEALETEFALVSAGQRYTMLGHLPIAFDTTVMALMGLLFAPTGLLDQLDPSVRADMTVAAAHFLFPEWEENSLQQSKTMLAGLTPSPGLGAEFGRLALQNAHRNSPDKPVYQRRLQWVEAYWAMQSKVKANDAAAPCIANLFDQIEIRRIVMTDRLDRDAQTDTLAVIDALKAHVERESMSLKALHTLYLAARQTTSVGTSATNTPGSVCVTTYLGSKGKEFEAVILGDASDDKVPLASQFTSPLRNTADQQWVERNLFYVAITRTRFALWVLHRKDRAVTPYIEMMRSVHRSSTAKLDATKPAADTAPDANALQGDMPIRSKRRHDDPLPAGQLEFKKLVEKLKHASDTKTP